MKRFKEWENKFTTVEIVASRQKWLYNGSIEADRCSYVKWPVKVAQWEQEFVQYCVYELHDPREWQLFRVSMKGLTTYEKLYMLHNRFITLCEEPSSKDEVAWHVYKIEKCRIDNYIGALVRGGQLNSNLEIVK